MRSALKLPPSRILAWFARSVPGPAFVVGLFSLVVLSALVTAEPPVPEQQASTTGVQIQAGPSSAHRANREQPAQRPTLSGPYGLLPTVLTAEDTARYRTIFALQEQGWWPAADRMIAQLEDPLLLSYVQHQRYLHPTAYRSKYGELRDWLKVYADRPGADVIYRLALKRRPKGAKRPQRPKTVADSLGAVPALAEPYRSEKKLSWPQRRRVQKLQRRIRYYLRKTRLPDTEKLLATAEVRRLFDRVQVDDAYSKVAAGRFYLGDAEQALDLARAVAFRSGVEVPLSHWTAGLAAWRLGRVDLAVHHFEALALSHGVSGWNRAAGGYWAARVHFRQEKPAEADHWLMLAAEHPRTFYGLLARERLGIETEFFFDNRLPSPAAREALLGEPAVRRALALIQLSEIEKAERELLTVRTWSDPAVADGLLAVAQFMDMPSISFKLADKLRRDERGTWSEELLDGGLYPIPPWQPRSGFKLDRALVFAVMRQESSFDRFAKSPDGARGLMQLMPRTARAVARSRRFRGQGRDELYQPDLNIDLGQRYLSQLLKSSRVDGDLFRLAAAYNGGPGNLGKWQRQMEYGDDPLLFIESIPLLETRLFVERVLTNLWIYRKRLGQPAPSLTALAAGQWPVYRALDDGHTPRLRRHADARDRSNPVR